MKNVIKNILWCILNHLDPFEFVKVDIDTHEVKMQIGKRFFRKNEWTHFAGTVEMWVKKEGKGEQRMDEIKIYRNGKLSAKKYSRDPK